MRILPPSAAIGLDCPAVAKLPYWAMALAFLGLTAVAAAHAGDAIRDDAVRLRNELVFAETFEGESHQLIVSKGFVTDPGAAITGQASLTVNPGGSAQTNGSTLSLESNCSYLLLFRYRIDTPFEGQSSLTVRAHWKAGEAQFQFAIAPSADVALGQEAIGRHYFTFGDVDNPSFEIATAANATVTIDELYIFKRRAVYGPTRRPKAAYGFPRLAKQVHGTPLAQAEALQKSLHEVLEELTRFDILFGFDGDATQGYDWITQARELNPSILLLPRVDTQRFDPTKIAAAKASDANGLWAEIVSSDWELSRETGDPVFDILAPGQRLLNPAAETADNLWSALAKHADASILAYGQFDGLMLADSDRYPNFRRLTEDGSSDTLPPLDLDRDGSAETIDQIIRQWPLRYPDLFSKFRSELAQNTFLLASSTHLETSANGVAEANGFVLTTPPYVSRPEGDWDTSSSARFESLRQLRAEARNANRGIELQISLFDGKDLGAPSGDNTPMGNTDRIKSLASEDLRRMRFGLVNALLEDRYFAYDWVDASSPVVWFDEYAVAKDGVATNSRFGRGYLGQPIGPAQRLALDETDALLRLEFEAEDPASLQLNGEIVTDSGTIISGSRSLKVTLGVDAEPTEFLRLPASEMGLQPGQSYELELSYRVIDYTPRAFRSIGLIGFGGQSYAIELSIETALDSVGETLTVSGVFLVENENADLVGSIEEAGAFIVDDISIRPSKGVVYRRDFENGIALLNPSPSTAELTQEQVVGSLDRAQPRRILGQQAPEINDGSKITDGLLLAAGDAIVILADRISGEPLLTPEVPSVSQSATTSVALEVGGPAPASLSHYCLEYGLADGKLTEFRHIPARAPLIVDGLPPSTTFAGRLRAIDFNGRESSPSDLFHFTTLGTPQERPSILSFSSDLVSVGDAVALQTSGLGIENTTDYEAPYPTHAENVSVTFNGEPAPILQLATDRVSVVVPSSLALGEPAIVRVHKSGVMSPSSLLQVRDPNQAQAGNVVGTQLSESGALYQLEGGAIAEVSIVADGTARIRLAPDGEFRSWNSGAVVFAGSAPTVTISDDAVSTRFESELLTIIVNKLPFTVRTLDRNGTILTDEEGLGASWRMDRDQVDLKLKAPVTRKYFGSGLRGGPLDRRGERITLRNRDFAGYEEFDSPLYSSIPFFLAVSQLTFHGIFADMPAHAYIDFDSQENQTLTVSAQQNEIDYYVFAGPLPEQVMSAYHRLTGAAPLPPKWALGYHQSRYGYHTWDITQIVADGLRSYQIPADALHLDIDWMQDYEPFTWNSASFPDHTYRLSALSEDGFRIVTIVDPFIPADGPTWNRLAADNLLVRDLNGDPFRSEIFLGEVGWMDFGNPGTATWYREGVRSLLASGVSGIWNDLNEPADNFLTDALFDFEGRSLSETQTRNLYALTELAQTYSAMLEADPQTRPFILTRAGYSGFHRYAASWSGDTNSSFDALRVAVQTSLHMSLSGSPLFGHDVGGFLGSPTPELFIRWLQFSSYTPFFRNHAHRITDLREPWQFGDPYTGLARATIEQRYRLLPYWYSLFDSARENGSAVLGPTFTRFPFDPTTFTQSTEFMVGPYLLVAPVFNAGAETRAVYLPAGHAWYDRRANQRFDGGQTIIVNAPLGEIPVFARSDAIIPFGPVRQHTGQSLENESLSIDIYPDEGDGFTIYEDDGISYDYQAGDYLRTIVTTESGTLRKQIHFRYEGSWSPPERTIWVNLHDSNSKARFMVIDGILHSPSADFEGLASQDTGWYRSSATGVLTVRARQGVERITLLYEEPAAGANPHIYYRDSDGDLQGDVNDAYLVYANAPLLGLVARSGDPDDEKYGENQAVAPRGERQIAAPLPVDGVSVLSDLGITIVAACLNWREVETDPYIYSDDAFSELSELLSRSAMDLPIRLSLPIYGEAGPIIPEDLAAPPIEDADLVKRYVALLDEIKRRLQIRTLHSLSIGSALDSSLPADARASFINLAEQIAGEAKRIFGPQLTVGADIDIDRCLSPDISPFVEQLSTALDWIGLRYAPWPNADSIAYSPTFFSQSVERTVAAFPDTDFHLVDLSYPSSAVAYSSEMKQVYFYRELFAMWDRLANRIRLVVLGELNDLSDESASQKRVAIQKFAEAGNLAVSLEKMLGSSGLFNLHGSRKPAFSTLRDSVFERGWNVFAPVQRRTVRLGLTTDPYDLDPGHSDPAMPFIDDVMDEVFRIAHENAEVIEYHFDKGVPWLEAYSDTFESSSLPYSQNVRSHWEALRVRRGQGNDLIVSINPLGIPRKRIAAYWGYGEGFYQNEEGDRVPNGIYQDYNQRIPPGLWKTRKPNDEAVKTAYLSYAKRAIEYFQPEYLNLAVEANEAIDGGEEFFNQYLELHKHVYEALKSDPDYEHVKIVVTFSVEFLMRDELGVPYLVAALQNPDLVNAHFGMLESLLPYVDVVGISLHPIKVRWPNDTLPVEAFARLFRELRQLTHLPLAITETGYPADSFSIGGRRYESTPQKQERYLQMILALAEQSGGFDFIINYGIRDFTARMDKLRERSKEEPPFTSPFLTDFFRIFESIGLYEENGDAKPATRVWQDHLTLPLDASKSNKRSISLVSPGGTTRVTVGIDGTDQAYFQAFRDGAEALGRSKLGIDIDEWQLGREAVAIELIESREIDETYPVLGATATARNHCLEHTLQFTHGSSVPPLIIRFRIYDDGVAYRYRVPEGLESPVVNGEASSWSFPSGATLWFQDNTANYEGHFRSVQLGQTNDEIGGQILVEVPTTGHFLLASEAALLNYSGMTLRTAFFTEEVTARFLDDERWPVDPGQWTPWRYTIIALGLNELTASSMATNLNEPPDPEIFPQGILTPWIRPGKALWSWWTDDESGRDFDTQKRYVDFAAQHGIEYVVVDIHWEEGFATGTQTALERLEELVDYARSDGKKVGIWVWKDLTEAIDSEERSHFLDVVRSSGVAGVKYDLIFGTDSESLQNVQLHEAILREAAERQIMVNFHGTHKAHGLHRTYPNEITREGFAGLENNSILWSDAPDEMTPPRHNAALLFVRGIIGPADYTPVTLDPRKTGDTTFAHQLALAGVVVSPLIHYADSPEILFSNEAVADLLSHLPTTWDESRLLAGAKIGRNIAVARRKGTEWWLFALNGSAEEELDAGQFDLEFLEGAARYDATFITDADRHALARTERKDITRRSRIPHILLPGGGVVGRFRMRQQYTSWAQQRAELDPSLLDQRADSDDDGLSNLFEYAFDTNPLIPEARRDLLLRALRSSPTSDEIWLEVPGSDRSRPWSEIDLVSWEDTVKGLAFQLERSSDGREWMPAEPHKIHTAFIGEGGLQRQSVVIPFDSAGSSKMLFRLSITELSR